MANPRHLAKLKKGVDVWNKWLQEGPEFRRDLTGARLDGAILHDADFIGVDLSSASLARAQLDRAVLLRANLERARLHFTALADTVLRRANLHRAGLFGADLRGADLGGATLAAADLRSATFSGTNLREADLTGAAIGRTIFANVDLSQVRGLDTVEHEGPSTIGVDTIYRSQGKIPHIFLRRTGVPESLIEYIASLVGTGIEFYSLFISYSTKDQAFADRLYADLQARGVRCWFAPHDMRSGEWIQDQIDRAIQMQDRLLLILSEQSIRSDWVKREIRKAYKRGLNENRRVLYPVSLCPFDVLKGWEETDPDTGTDLALEVRRYFITDFSNWKDHDSYKTAFDRLLKDLQGKA
jgi:hypothetical protein